MNIIKDQSASCQGNTPQHIPKHPQDEEISCQIKDVYVFLVFILLDSHFSICTVLELVKSKNVCIIIEFISEYLIHCECIQQLCFCVLSSAEMRNACYIFNRFAHFWCRRTEAAEACLIWQKKCFWLNHFNLHFISPLLSIDKDNGCMQVKSLYCLWTRIKEWK